MPTHDNWRWCRKCQGLAFAGNSTGACPAGGPHDFTGSNNYSLGYTVDAEGAWVAVPNVIGHTKAEADNILRNAGLSPTFTGTNLNGHVNHQSPGVGTLVTPGTLVTCHLL